MPVSFEAFKAIKSSLFCISVITQEYINLERISVKTKQNIETKKILLAFKINVNGKNLNILKGPFSQIYKFQCKDLREAASIVLRHTCYRARLAFRI